MISRAEGEYTLTCNVCGKIITDTDELNLLETAARQGWIGYYPEDPHHHVKFEGRHPLHFCSIECEDKLLYHITK